MREAIRRIGALYAIEAQIRAVELGAKICETPVRERQRIAGEQKVSRVSWQHTLKIGAEIVCAGWRTRFPKRSVDRQLLPAEVVREQSNF